MPVNTESAALTARPNRNNSNLRGRNLRAAQLRWDRENQSRQAPEVTNLSANAITRGRGTVIEAAGARAAAISEASLSAREAATNASLASGDLAGSAADAFTVGYGAGQVDPALARALEADATTDTPSPSTIQQTNAVPAASTTPSLSGRQNQSFSTLSPRPYFRIDPLDIRYDFLTGQKVNTTGGQPNINNPTRRPGGGNTTGGTGIGGSPGTSDISIGYGEGQIDPALARAAGLEGNLTEEQRQDTGNADTGTRTIQGVEVPADFPNITLNPGEEFLFYRTDGAGNYVSYSVRRTGTTDDGFDFTEQASIPIE